MYLDDPPTMEKLETALSRLKVRKAGGLYPEMILCVGPVLCNRLLTLMEAVWREGEADLKKAYDSVSRNALWTVLAKCGVPPTMLNVIRSFHEGMLAGVRVGSAVTNCFEV